MLYFHAVGGKYCRLVLGVPRKDRDYLSFEESGADGDVRPLGLHPLQVPPGEWVPVVLKVRPFEAIASVGGDSPGTATARPTRSQGRIGLGAAPGAECRFRKLVVKDRGGVLVSAY
jgi:hypothetical protein